MNLRSIVALRKVVPFEKCYSFEFRAEFFNAFNPTQFQSPAGRQGATNVGPVSAARDPRIGQVAARFTV